ncbi:MAG: sugar phosphate nucleotidyltransferase [Wolinella sp.]
MRAVILAAGRGSRLAPLTDDKPKTLVEYEGRAILSYVLDSLISAGIDEIGIVAGYKSEVLEQYLKENYANKANIKIFMNHQHERTNMVYSLMCARDFLLGDVIISYSDIIYSGEIVHSLMEAKSEVNVVVDLAWRELWNRRFIDPLSDAETLKIKEGKIIEIGKKPSGYHEIEGQYIGLIKVAGEFIKELLAHYDSLDKEALYEGKDKNNLYMTSFIQSIIDTFNNVQPVYIHGGWCEIDSPKDLTIQRVHARKESIHE